MSNTFTEGEAFAPQRSLFNALGFTKDEKAIGRNRKFV